MLLNWDSRSYLIIRSFLQVGPERISLLKVFIKGPLMFKLIKCNSIFWKTNYLDVLGGYDNLSIEHENSLRWCLHKKKSGRLKTGLLGGRMLVPFLAPYSAKLLDYWSISHLLDVVPIKRSPLDSNRCSLEARICHFSMKSVSEETILKNLLLKWIPFFAAYSTWTAATL